MQTKYSKEFKIEVIKKILSRNPETSISSIVRSLDLKMSTVWGWIKTMTNKEDKAPLSREGENEKSPQNWTLKEKFEAIVEAGSLSDDELSQYCRKRGIFPHHLSCWKSEFLNSSSHSKINSDKEVKELKTQVKALNTELKRKEKALAEAAALLILKKKVENLWGSDEED